MEVRDTETNGNIAIFLDRDGTINEDSPDYVKCLEEFEFLPNALDALKRLGKIAVPIIIVTNQSQIGRGVTPAHIIEELNQYMLDAIHAHGGRIDDLYLCPHAPADHCDCRKPKPGLLLRAGKDYGVDLSKSFMVGDRYTDMGAATEAGCIAILISPDLSVPENVQAVSDPVVVRDLMEACAYIEAHIDLPSAS